MQTFLPYPDFEASARCLDRQRLGKQRVEAMQIWDVIRYEERAWSNHPAVRMWRGHSDALAAYHDATIREWERRGYVNNLCLLSTSRHYETPPWLGDERLHRSHQANLMRKMPDHYGHMFPGVDPTMPYWWPV